MGCLLFYTCLVIPRVVLAFTHQLVIYEAMMTQGLYQGAIFHTQASAQTHQHNFKNIPHALSSSSFSSFAYICS